MSNKHSFKRRPTALHEPEISSVTVTANPRLSVFDQLSESAFVRESDLVRNPRRPGSTVPLPFSSATLWRKVKSQQFPQPIRFFNRITCWQVGAVRKWMQAANDTGGVL